MILYDQYLSGELSQNFINQQRACLIYTISFLYNYDQIMFSSNPTDYSTTAETAKKIIHNYYQFFYNCINMGNDFYGDFIAKL